MLIFIDEAGDTGFKFNKHSSELFTIGMVIFEDNSEAQKCDERINRLRKELGKSDNYEFHYKLDSDYIKEEFMKAVSPFNFFYYGIVINKKLLDAENFNLQEPFYKYVCSLVFENAKEKIHDATVIIDGTYSKDFERRFQKYLKDRFNTDSAYKIKKVKMQDSKKNNLIQLADYIASGIHREKSSKKNTFLKPVKHREIDVQLRPK